MVDHLQSHGTPWRQCANHVKVRGTLSKMVVSWLNSPGFFTFLQREKVYSGDFLVNVRACGLVLVSDKFIQRITCIMMLVINL